MDLTSWPQVQPINQKNYYTDYLKRDEQILAFRLQQEEARNKMVKQAKDRDRALAQGKPIGPDGDVEMDDDQEVEEEDEVATGSKTIVIHIGSQNMRIGLASDALPKTVPMVVARKAPISESEEGDEEPKPKRVKLEDGRVPEPEKQFGEQFGKQYSELSAELRTRMRHNKRRVLPQSRDMVVSYNRRTTHDTITEHNDPMRIEWTDTSADGQRNREYITGKEALRIPDKSQPRYKLFWPIRCGWVNEVDYESKRFLYEDIRIIIEEAVKSQLGLAVRTRKDWVQYSCVLVIPDYYERTYVTSLLDLAIADLGFGRVCFIQESLAASFGAGFTTSCIVDIGSQKTSICCVEDGMCIDSSRVNLKYGGLDVTETFIKMMLYNHFPYTDINLRRRYDFQLAEELKQKFLTMNEADISVQLYDFHLRAPGQDTRKYTFKCYDEVLLASSGFFKPEIFDHTGKLTGRRRLIDKSYDLYEEKPNDPTSGAQEEILRAIAPADILAAKGNVNGKTNGVPKEENGYFSDSHRPSIGRLQEADGTPLPSHASSPVRNLEATPQPEAGAGTPLPRDDKPKEEEEEEPFPIERRDDILPVYPLPEAIMRSINHAARGSPGKTKDLLGSIMLIGGASAVSGLPGYLEDALKVLLIQKGYDKDIVVGRPPRELDAQVVVWKGAAVFGRMARTNDSWVSWEVYERLGERCLAHKMMFAW
jgi:actin-related protein 8